MAFEAGSELMLTPGGRHGRTGVEAAGVERARGQSADQRQAAGARTADVQRTGRAEVGRVGDGEGIPGVVVDEVEDHVAAGRRRRRDAQDGRSSRGVVRSSG